MATAILSSMLTGCQTTKTETDSTTNMELTVSTDSLSISKYATSWAYNETYDVYYVENVVYCADPVDETYQSMNIYVPAAYMNEDGTLKEDGTITNTNGVSYTTATAPIVYSNGVWGYSQATPAVIDDTTADYTSQGYILVCVGSRGKETVNADGTYIGKAPEGLVDLKAGVRYLKYNDEAMAGDTSRIISVGLSAGGGMSSLLGTTGNSEDYSSYLEEIGAAMEETDDVYAAMAYCPITDLDNSDMIYEWMFGSDTAYSGDLGVNRGNASSDTSVKGGAQSDGSTTGKGAMTGASSGKDTGELTEEEIQAYRAQGGKGGSAGAGADSAAETELTEFEQALSSDLAALYPSYVNGLNLGLTLSEDGRSGSYYEGMMEVISDALNTYLAANYTTAEEKAEYIATLNIENEWVAWDAATETASIDDIDSFVANYLGRAKSVAGFDSIDLSAQENSLFGSDTVQLSHYSALLAEVLSSNDYSSLEGYDESKVAAYSDVLLDSEVSEQTSLMNPFTYIGTGETDVAPYFRIRVGTQDADSAFATAFNLATSLEQQGVEVDYAMLWGQGHRVMETNGEFSAWIDEICQNS